MADFDDFLKALKSELIEIGRDAAEDIQNEVVQDGQAFVNKTREDLQRWTTLLSLGELSREEFEYLLEAKKDLAEMEALKQKGLAMTRIDKLRNAVIGAIVGSAMNIFG